MSVLPVVVVGAGLVGPAAAEPARRDLPWLPELRLGAPAALQELPLTSPAR
ncbi:hypothetical protein ACFO5K_22675 [Nocardia halotolerans]|uniref:Uncharacterized protein n=1 Tax=Nocardia halotolerans TaxID=1755878 RepID=A0ABV8VLG6_9NOCA